jgi:hypothetical protein
MLRSDGTGKLPQRGPADKSAPRLLVQPTLGPPHLFWAEASSTSSPSLASSNLDLTLEISSQWFGPRRAAGTRARSGNLARSVGGRYTWHRSRVASHEMVHQQSIRVADRSLRSLGRGLGSRRSLHFRWLGFAPPCSVSIASSLLSTIWVSSSDHVPSNGMKYAK